MAHSIVQTVGAIVHTRISRPGRLTTLIAAYVFERNEGGPDAWGQVAKLRSADGAAFDYFGSSVSIGRDQAIVGAPSDDDNGWESGSAYLFRRDLGGPNSWGLTAKLIAPPGNSQFFGRSVAIADDAAVIGAYKSDESHSGSVYVYLRTEGELDAWFQIARVPPVGNSNTGIGQSVDVSGPNRFSVRTWTTHSVLSQDQRLSSLSATGSSLPDSRPVTPRSGR